MEGPPNTPHLERKKLSLVVQIPWNCGVARPVFALENIISNVSEVSGASQSPAKPAAVLGLTLLLIGLAFALPLRLIPEGEFQMMSGNLSPEVLNVYALTAWMGWAHFIYAFRGQSGALNRLRDTGRSRRILTYLSMVALTIVALFGARSWAGPALFGAVVWVYFIDHFIKAEQSFEGKSQPPPLVRWLKSYQPLLAFAWLSVVLLNVGHINSLPWSIWVVSAALGALVLGLGGWKNLWSGEARSSLLSLFFIAEALVWGAFSSYGGPIFLTGVYVFHIAAGSFFHYFGSYFYGQSRAKGRDIWLNPLVIIAINVVVIGLGLLTVHTTAVPWLFYILGVPWFTLWVAVHLVVSDLFPAIRKWRASPAQ